MIAIIDYGMGNLRSIQKAVERVGHAARICSKANDVRRANKIILPGVGAFGDAMRELKRRKLIAPLKEALRSSVPFLGLCLGLQLLFERSEEDSSVKGLGLLRGAVKRFRFKRKKTGMLKIPHMGWNSITINSTGAAPSKIFHGVPDGALMYFVHSYYAAPHDKDITLTTTQYGRRFVSGIRKGNMYAFQFHPEKSQALGLRILKNFVETG